MELTVLGCSGSFGGAGGAACSGYLLQSDGTSIWVDCGNGTFGHLQEHLAVENLTAVVLTHGHPDHCVDIYGLHVYLRYGLGIQNLPVYAPEGLEKFLLSLVSDWGDTLRLARGGRRRHRAGGRRRPPLQPHRPPAAHVRGGGAPTRAGG